MALNKKPFNKKKSPITNRPADGQSLADRFVILSEMITFGKMLSSGRSATNGSPSLRLREAELSLQVQKLW